MAELGFSRFWEDIKRHFETTGQPSDRNPEPTGVHNYLTKNRLFWLHVLVRSLSVIFVTTEFVPDEGWQSTEVAHHLVYGGGYLTWEWSYGLRSYLYPLLLSVPMWILKVLRLDTPLAFILTTRIMHATLLFLGEQAFFQFNITKYGYKSAKWGLGAMISCWFLFYCGSRSLTNVTELALNMIASNLFHKRSYPLFTIILALNFVIRPTAVVYWLIFIPSITRRLRDQFPQLYICGFIGLVVLGLNFALDSYFYQRYVLTWYDFLDFNIIQRGSEIFGTHPFTWYLYSGIPSIIGFSALLVYVAFLFRFKRYKDEFTIMMVYVAIYSIIPHKEIRFLLPIVPHLCMVSGDIWEAIIHHSSRYEERIRRLCRTALLCTVSANIVAAIFFSKFHQAGIWPASKFIYENTKNNPNATVWIFLPCFALPVHTYLHHPTAKIEYYTCSPKGFEEDSQNKQQDDFEYVDHTDQGMYWMHKPTGWKLDPRYKDFTEYSPDYVLLYSRENPVVTDMFQSYFFITYELCFTHYHTAFPFDNVGDRVDVLCKNPPEEQRLKNEQKKKSEPVPLHLAKILEM